MTTKVVRARYQPLLSSLASLIERLESASSPAHSVLRRTSDKTYHQQAEYVRKRRTLGK
jgi:hypothetical protein